MALATLLAGLLVTAAAVWQRQGQLAGEANARYQHRVDRLAGEIAHRFDGIAAGLQSLQALHSASHEVEAAEFEHFVGDWALNGTLPGLISFGQAEPVRRGRLAEFIVHQRELTPGFALRSDGGQPVLWPMGLVAPLAEHFEAWGQDLAEEPGLRAALQLAVASGHPTLAAHLPPGSAQGQAGFSYLMPVYRRGTDPVTPSQRQDALRSMLVASISANGLLAGLDSAGETPLAFSLRDGAGGASDLPIYSRPNSPGAMPAFLAERGLLVGQHPLRLSASSTPAFDAEQQHTRALSLQAASGLLLSLLLAGSIWAMASARARALALAASMTADLDRLSQVAERTSSAVMVMDAQGRIVWTNQAFSTMSGHSAEAALGQLPHALMRSNLGTPEAKAALAQAYAAGDNFDGEIENRRPDGQVYWTRTEVRPLRSAEGQLTGFMAIDTDVTAVRQANQALQRERQRLDHVLEGSDVGSWEFNAQTGEILADARWAAMFGYAVAEVQPFSFARFCELVHPDDVPAMLAQGRAHHAGALSHYEVEQRVRHADGRWIWTQSRAKFVSRTPEGLPEWAAGTHIDISQRKAHEAELAEQRLRTDTIFASLPGVVYEFERPAQGESRFVFLSGSAASVLGLTPAELLADRHQLYRNVHGDDLPGLNEDMNASSRDLTPLRSEFRLRVGEAWRWIAVDALPTRREDGGIVWYGMLMDVCARKQIEAQLAAATQQAEAANRAKSAFLATMSHEIRTPMNGVIGMAELLAQSALTEEQADAVHTMRDSASSLLRLIDDILDFSKIEAGHLVLERTPVRLAALVERLCDALQPVATARQVELQLFCSPALPELVMTDPVRLRQIVNNLLSNAIKFSAGLPGRRGRVALRVEPDCAQPGQVRFEVSDNGIGMDPATIDRIFLPFTQAEVSTTRRFGGTGLGLTISERLISLLDGRIQVRSEPGLGTTFEVGLPLPAADPALATRHDSHLPGQDGDRLAPAPVLPEPAWQPSATPELHGLTVLLMAQGALPTDDLAAYLVPTGARVQRVNSLTQAQDLAAAHAGPVVLVDAADDSPPDWRSPLPGMPGDLRQLLIGGGRLGPAQLVAPNVGALGVLRRQALLRGVAMMAGRASPELRANVTSAAALGLTPVPAPGARSLVRPGIADDPQQPPAPPPLSVAEARARGRLILVAEDDPVNQKVIQRQLALLGHTAEVVDDGRQALQRWREGQHALLLTDLHMPELDGYSLATQLRREESPGQHMPIVALTANALKSEEQRALAAGMDGYLTKPVPLRALRIALDAWLPPRHEATPPAESLPAPSATSAPLVPASLPPEVLPVLRLDVLRALIGDAPEVVDEFLREFRSSARTLAHELRLAHAAGDAKQAAALAHKLKSSSRSVGALALGELCATLEQQGRRLDPAALTRGLAEFEQAFAALEQALATALGQARGQEEAWPS